MNIRVLFLLAGCLIPATLGAQALSRKDASAARIKSVSEYETDAQNSRAKPVLECFTRYDASGNLLEIIERDNTGYVTLHESYEYNEKGDKTVEIQYEPNGAIKKKHVYTYANGLRSERMTYDKNGKLLTRKKYTYEFHEK